MCPVPRGLPRGAILHPIRQGTMAVVPQILEGVQPVVGASGVDVGAVGIGENTAYSLVIGLARGPVEGGVCTIRNEGKRRFGSNGRHLRKSEALSMGER